MGGDGEFIANKCVFDLFKAIPASADSSSIVFQISCVGSKVLQNITLSSAYSRWVIGKAEEKDASSLTQAHHMLSDLCFAAKIVHSQGQSTRKQLKITSPTRALKTPIDITIIAYIMQHRVGFKIMRDPRPNLAFLNYVCGYSDS